MKFEFELDDELEVELRPHKGKVRTPAGEITVRLPQDIIFINGHQSGYVGTDAGSQINLIVGGLPQEALDFVKKKVDELREEATGKVAQITTLAENTVVLQSEEPNNLEDEEL